MAAPAAAEPRQPPADGVGVYRPRRPRASPLYQILELHFRELCLVWDERFASTSGGWRAVIPKVVDQFLACGLLEHGFARIRCDTCAHEYLLAFSSKARYFCPSCHAKRLARWSLWLDQTLLAAVPHRQLVLTIPKRLRPSCLYRRALLGDLAAWSPAPRPPPSAPPPGRPISGSGSSPASRPTAPSPTGTRISTLLVTDGGFRPDGTFVRWPDRPGHDTAQLTEACRRTVLRLFGHRGLFDEEQPRGCANGPRPQAAAK